MVSICILTLTDTVKQYKGHITAFLHNSPYSYTLMTKEHSQQVATNVKYNAGFDHKLKQSAKWKVLPLFH